MRGTGYNGALRIGDIVMTLKREVADTLQTLLLCNGSVIPRLAYPELYDELYDEETGEARLPDLPVHYRIVAEETIKHQRSITQGRVGDDNLTYGKEIMVFNTNPQHPRAYVSEAERDGLYKIPVTVGFDPLFILSKNKMAQVFQPSTFYNEGDLVVPTVFNGFAYEALNSGYTSIVEPPANEEPFAEFEEGSIRFKVKHFDNPIVIKIRYGDI